MASTDMAAGSPRGGYLESTPSSPDDQPAQPEVANSGARREVTIVALQHACQKAGALALDACSLEVPDAGGSERQAGQDRRVDLQRPRTHFSPAPVDIQKELTIGPAMALFSSVG
jgi:hypothetical protein